jgi:hypothetical protein
MLRGIAAYLRRHHIALLALFFAMGGTAMAAGSLINGSQIKPHTIAKNRLTTQAVKQLKGNKGARGVPGAAGPQGPQGLQGPPGAPNPNADTLNGYAANGLVRVARVHPGGTALTTSDATVATVSITAPAAGFVMLQADYSIAGTGCPCSTFALLRDNVTGALIPNYRGTRVEADGNYQGGAIVYVFPVTAGVRTFDLRAKKLVGTSVTIDSPTLQALYVPFGSTGGSTLSAATSGVSASSTGK